MHSVEEILAKHPNAKRDSLIPILQEIQESEGYISRDSIATVGRHLRLPASKIYGVATFYNQFRFEPLGKFHIQICRGTACHVKNSVKVLETFKRELKIEPGRATRDGMFSMEIVACLGACGLAPVIAINGEFIANVSPDDVNTILKSYHGKAANNGR